jgi:hypothetical protein
MDNERNVLTYTVNDLLEMLVNKGGTSAHFTFKKEDGEEIIAVIAIALMEDAYRLKAICKEYFSE